MSKDDNFSGQRFTGPNIYIWEQEVQNFLGRKGIADHLVETKTPPPSPLENPARYALLAPDYTVEPKFGSSAWEGREARSGTSRRANTEDGFSSYAKETFEGMLTRLSTTNQIDRVETKLVEWERKFEKAVESQTKARSLILSTINYSLINRLDIQPTDCTKEIYDKARAFAKKMAIAQKHSYTEQWEAITRHKGESVDTFVNRINSLAYMLDLGSTNAVEDSAKLYRLLKGCKDEFETEVRNLNIEAKTKTITFAEAADHLSALDYEKKGSKQPRQDKDGKDGNANKNTTANALAGQQQPGAGRNSQQKPGAARTNPRTFTVNSNTVCRRCEGKGHIEKDCGTPKPESDSRADAAKGGNGNGKRNGGRNGGRDDEAVSLVGKPNSNVEVATPVGMFAAVLDSGAGVHMTGNADLFERDGLKELKTLTSVIIGDGTRLQVSSMGTALFWGLNTDNNWQLIRLENCWFVPGLEFTLISVKQILGAGREAHFEHDKVTIKDDNGRTVICIAGGENDFKIPAVSLKASPRRPTIQGPAVLAAIASTKPTNATESLRFWHFRLGHASSDVLKRMAKAGDIPNVSATAWDAVKLDFCEPCALGKARRGTFSDVDRTDKATRPFEKVHSDLSGRVPTRSKGGAEYYMTWTDENTDKTWVDFLKTKDGALPATQKWLEESTLGLDDSDRKLKNLRTDGGGEYIDAAGEKWFASNGILHEKTAPESPQQNGIAERKNLTIMNDARTYMAASNLRKDLWPYAVKYAVYVRNRLPNASRGGKTPEELWTGKKPDISDIKIFGATAYKFVNRNQTKLGDRTIKLVFVGYPDKQAGYLLADTKTGTVSVAAAQHVIFDESTINDLMRPTNSNTPVPESPMTKVSTLSAADADGPQYAEEEYSDDEDINIIPNMDSSPQEKGGTGHRLADRNADDEGHNDGDETFGPRKTTRAGAGTRKDPNRSLTEQYYDTVNSYKAAQSKGKTLGDAERGQEPLEQGPLEFADIALALTAQQAAIGDSKVPINDDPSYDEAIGGPQKEEWINATIKEIAGLVENDTFAPAVLPPGRSAVGGKFVHKIKRYGDGTIDKFKTRLVARGFTQREGIDYDEVYSPVAKYSTIRWIVSLLTNPKVKARQTDAPQAYLKGGLDQEIYFAPPKGFLAMLRLAHEDEDLAPGLRVKMKQLLDTADEAAKNGRKLVYRLVKPLYGLKQAGFEWNKTLDSAMREIGFSNYPADPCLYSKIEKDGTWTATAVWVDDFIWAGIGDGIDHAIDALKLKFGLQDMGEPKWLLGMQITRGPGIVTLDQKHYIAKLLERFNMTDCKPVGSPADPSQKPFYDWAPKNDEERKEMAKTPFAELVGALMFLANGTRPDIMAAVSILARHMANPGPMDWVAGKRVLRYLKGTMNVGIKYTDDPSTSDIIGYSDADWASNLEDRKSTSGYVFLRAGGAISWQTRKQPTPALSSSESELLALTSALKEAMSWRHRLYHIGFAPTTATMIKCDNQGAMVLIRNPASRETTKHIAIRSFFARDLIDRTEVNVEFVPSEDNAADALTKALNPEQARRSRELLGLAEIKN